MTFTHVFILHPVQNSDCKVKNWPPSWLPWLGLTTKTKSLRPISCQSFHLQNIQCPGTLFLSLFVCFFLSFWVSFILSSGSQLVSVPWQPRGPCSSNGQGALQSLRVVIKVTGYLISTGDKITSWEHSHHSRSLLRADKSSRAIAQLGSSVGVYLCVFGLYMCV